MIRWLATAALSALCLAIPALGAVMGDEAKTKPLKAGIFSIDASPTVGKPLAYDPTKGTVHPLSFKGVVLIGDDTPIVLCAIDWIGVANDGQRMFREAMAEAAGTTVDRVEIHALHQHDAPACDPSAIALLEPYGIGDEFIDMDLLRDVIARGAQAVKKAVAEARPVSHLGLGEGIVEKVASNRRVMGPDGKVAHVRFSSCKDPEVRDAPEGTIDPKLKMISLWEGDEPIVLMTFYATHPQSYYRTGLANPDFPGIARDQRQEATGVPHIHFNGASGDIAAGKYNDGSTENRQILADRVRAGMDKAWESTIKSPIAAADLGWKVVPVALPVDPRLDEKALEATVNDEKAPARQRYVAARGLVWVRRCKNGETINTSRLRLGEKARVLHMPGELFVEYQLAAQKLRPDLFVAMAAYGDYGPGYIGTKESYPQGGYETQIHVSRVAPEVEDVLNKAIADLLKD